jgi:muramidase (phage lysozyme)
MTPNLKAFLDMIAVSELGPAILAGSNNGYNVLVGSTPKNIKVFYGYEDHPRILVDLPKLGIKSSASGRYQILARYFDAYKKSLKLPDFSPISQDKIAEQMIRECGALRLIEDGKIEEAIHRCRSRWASLPGAGYKQHENKLADLLAAYEDARSSA